jgi:hypothetical protein
MVYLTLLLGCSIAAELIAPVANFGLGLYNADSYYSNECAWYEPVWFSDETKEWIRESKPNKGSIEDLAKVARNNDIFKEVCDDS